MNTKTEQQQQKSTARHKQAEEKISKLKEKPNYHVRKTKMKENEKE